MEDPHVVGMIARRLSRVACVRMCWVNKTYNKLFAPYTHARLTTAQEEAVEKILKLTFYQWRQHVYTCTGDDFIIGSATSTGKTAIILAAAGRFVKEQKKQVIITVPALLVSQWVTEYNKFRLQLELPDLFVFDGLDLKRWKVAPDGIALVTLPLLMNKSYEEWRERFLSQRWEVVFGDEVSSNPVWFPRILPNCFLVSANATARHSNISKLQLDEELGSLPKTKFYFHELDGYVFPTNFAPKLKLPRKNIPFQDFVEAWADRLIHGQTLIALFGGPDRMPIAKATHCFPKAIKVRSGALSAFLADPAGVLVVPAKYIKKGINLPVETLIVMVLEYQLRWNDLVQLFGRVRRVQTHRRNVSIHVVTTEKGFWKEALMLHRTPNLLEPHLVGSLEAFRAAGYAVQDFAQPNIHTIKFLLDTPVKPPVEIVMKPTPRAWRPDNPDWSLLDNYSVLIAKAPKMLSLQIHRHRWGRSVVKQCIIETNAEPSDSFPPALQDKEAIIEEFKSRFLRYTGNFWEGRHQFQAHPGCWKLVTFYVAEFYEDSIIEQSAKRQKL